MKTCLLYLRGVKVKIKVFANRPKCVYGAIYSRAPLLRRSPFGSKLSIHTVSDGLSLIDLVDTCLFYLRVFKVKIQVFANRPKCICGAIYSRAPLHIQKVSFWLKALYLYTIRRFESHRPREDLPFIPPRRQSQNSRFSNPPKSEKSDWAAIYSRAPLHIQKLSFGQNHVYPYSIRRLEWHWPSVDLPFLPPSRQSQSSRFSNPPKSDPDTIYSWAPLHIQKLSLWLKGLYLYSIRLFRSDMPKVKVAFSSSKPSKSDQIHKKSETVNFLTRTSFTLESSYFG